MKTIYLDYAAATPMDPAVVAVMQPYLTEVFYNPSATYLAAKAVSKDIDDARGRIAGWLGVRSSEIIFTAGGTEANNLAIHGIMQAFPDGNVVVSSIEHDAVLEPAARYDCRQVAVTSDGRIDLETLERAIDDKTVLVSIMYANNEIGTVQPLKKVHQLIEKLRKIRSFQGNTLPLYFHTDACQATAYLDLHVSRLGVDMMTLNGGKIYGPKQSGALYVKAGVQLVPLIDGGGQERHLRSGTENVAGIVGLAAALDLVQSHQRDETSRVGALQSLFLDELHKQLPGAIVNGSLKHRLPSNVHLTIPGQDNERLVMALDEKGIQCAVGSACSASSDEPSHVLKAIGLDEAAIRSSLRFSFGRQTTEADIKRTITTLASLV